MTFRFDPKAVAKRHPASANPAKAANPQPKQAPRPAPISTISKISDDPRGYTPADLSDMDKLLRQLAKLEGWTDVELANKLDQRRRMAPVNVLPVLREIREAVRDALAGWPEKPTKRSDIRLCKLDHVELAVIEGSKAESNRPVSVKSTEPEAA